MIPQFPSALSAKIALVCSTKLSLHCARACARQRSRLDGVSEQQTAGPPAQTLAGEHTPGGVAHVGAAGNLALLEPYIYGSAPLAA